MRTALRNGELEWISSRLQTELRRSSGGTGYAYCSKGKLTRRAHRKSSSPSETRRFHTDSYGPCPSSRSSSQEIRQQRPGLLHLLRSLRSEVALLAGVAREVVILILPALQVLGAVRGAQPSELGEVAMKGAVEALVGLQNFLESAARDAAASLDELDEGGQDKRGSGRFGNV